MDIQATQNDSGDDQELAKALAGVNDQLESTVDKADTGLSFEETPSSIGGAVASPFGPPVPVPTPQDNAAADDTTTTFGPSTLPEPITVPNEPSAATPTPVVHASSLHSVSGLDSIKQDALTELRPLVDKLNVSAEEKFDTYLLLLRSTDDESLISPAHDAAKEIQDEARRAQALLDIIKEIDYLSSEKQAA